MNKILTKNNYTFQDSLTINNKLAMISDIGKRKKYNQDYGKIGIREKDGAYIMIVADGVSTSQFARVAAKTAVDEVFNELNFFSNFDKETMLRAIEKADKAVKKIPFDSSKKLDEPETTIVAAIIKNNKIIVGWVGDSRAYVMNSKEVYLLTEDDSWANKMIKTGKLTENETKLYHSKAHVITQCLGLRRAPIKIHVEEFDLEEDEGVLLCSDGLWGLIDINPIKWEHPANIEAWLLINQANKNGGLDNITVALKTPNK